MVSKIKTLITLLIFSTMGCEKEISLPNEDMQKIVAYGSLSDRYGAQIYISSTISISETPIKINSTSLLGCKVEIEELCTGKKYSVGEKAPGIYENKNIPLLSDCAYILHIEHSDYPDATSELVYLEGGFDIKLVNLGPTISEYPNNLVKVFEFEVDNNKSFPNFYLFSLYQKSQYTSDKTFEDLETGCPVFYSLNNLGHIISDKCLSKGKSTIYAAAVKRETSPQISNTLQVSRVSEILFEYSANLEQPEGFFTGLELPKLHKSNMNNGLGIFYLKQEAEFPFEL